MANTTRANFAFTLEYVSDVEGTKRFLVDVLGLEVEREAPEFVQFKAAANGTNFAIASDARMDPDVHGLEVWWLVDDADAAFKEMSSQAEVSMQPRQKPFGSVFGIKDPSGQVHYMVELPRNRPSKPPEMASSGSAR